MELTKSNEDYLEAIGLLVREKGAAQVRDIAAMLNVKMPSVTSAVRQLASMGLVEYVQYAPVRLTEEGAVLADKIIGSHRVLFEFFKDILDLPTLRADEIACLVEHIMKPEEIARLAKLTDWMMARPRLLRELAAAEEPPAPGSVSQNETAS